MANSENTAPETKILINDQDIPPDLRADILDVVVCQYLEGPDSFDIVVNLVDSQTSQIKWVDGDLLKPGNKVEIKLGYMDAFETLIIGEITALHPIFSSAESAKLHVQGFDKLHRLRRGRKTRSYNEMKDSQIAETVAQGMGLTPEVQDTAVVHSYVLQNNLSDFDFLVERARRIHYEVLVQGQKLIFRKVANNLGKSLTLEYAKNLKQFHPRLSTHCQVSEVKVRAWDPSKKEAILGVGKMGDENARMAGQSSGPQLADSAFGSTDSSWVTVPAASQAEADQIAKARFNQIALQFIEGEGEAVGNKGIKAGLILELKGLGSRFSGDYYLKKTEHRVNPKTGYVTRFSAVRNSA